jgi:O-antigen ligase
MLVAIIGLAGIVVASPKLSARVKTIGNLSNQISVTDRFSMWKSAADIWKDYPVLGIGVGQYQKAYQTKYCLPESQDYKLPSKERHNHPHSNFMLILSEAGIVGGTAYLVFLCLLLWFSFRGWWRTKNVLYLVLLSILLGTQLQGLMDTNIKMTVVCKMYWFFIGITLQMIGIDCAWNFAGEKVITHRKDE